MRGADTSAAELYAWLWTPDAPGMDLRHYDTRPHGLEAAYEDVQPGFSTAHGVGRTSELILSALTATPDRAETADIAQRGAMLPLLVCDRPYLHSVRPFGIWSLENRETAARRTLEERLDRVLNFYLSQPEQHGWYGFWDFGDVMHSFDAVRNVWRYDLGGMAWDNSELGTDLWLWYSYLHTGRAEVFRMAEAMTRHTGEVDCYHLGPFAGLGSRHNVRHWGCGAKEARISQAAYRRIHYYLTTDERTGDLMREVVNSDEKMREYDPMRLAQPASKAEKAFPARIRLGPDWLAFVGNWMTEWERTGDRRWRDKIMTGVTCLDAMPLGMRQGRNLVFGYDPANGSLFALGEEAGEYNLATIMGGAEVGCEVGEMLEDPKWDRLWQQYCRLYRAPKEVLLRDRQTSQEGMDGAFVRDGRLAAYLYMMTGKEGFRRVAVDALLNLLRPRRGGPLQVQRIDGHEVLNPTDVMPTIGTNAAAQDGLIAIFALEAVGAHLPAEIPAEYAAPSRDDPRQQKRKRQP